MTLTPKWIRLDNAAKIYPAAKSKRWTAMFRLSARLTEPVDPEVLEQAQRSVLDRFRYFSYILRRGMFWYYLEQSDDMPPIQNDVRNPCIPMDPKRNGGFSFRVRYYGNSIAVEIFHALTDGTGGLCFLNTLVAEYLRLKYGADIERGDMILDCTKQAQPCETEDSFASNAGDVAYSRAESDAYHITGIPARADKSVNIITGSIPQSEVKTRANELGVTVTEYLTALLIISVDAIQRRHVHSSLRYKPVKITVPVNLRSFFDSKTLRNFASYVNPGIDPRLGEYTLPEIAKMVHHFMAYEVTKKKLTAKFSANVMSADNKTLRIVPLFFKNIVMKLVFMAVGDKKSSTCFSNLGLVKYPPEMERYVRRVDFILGPLSLNKVAVAAIGYGDMLNISFTRTLKFAELEHEFFTRMVKLGIPVKIESNQRW